MEYKEKDVFKFRFNEDYIKKYPLENPYHCFDGQLVVKKRPSDDTLVFQDTYYSDSRFFTLDELEKIGTLKFVCNLDDVVDCNEWERRYYKEEDIIDLSYQHGCYKRYVKKKNARRSKEVMLQYINTAIEKKEREMKSLKDEIERYKEKQSLLNEQDCNLDEIYIPIY